MELFVGIYKGLGSNKQWFRAGAFFEHLNITGCLRVS